MSQVYGRIENRKTFKFQSILAVEQNLSRPIFSDSKGESERLQHLSF